MILNNANRSTYSGKHYLEPLCPQMALSRAKVKRLNKKAKADRVVAELVTERKLKEQAQKNAHAWKEKSFYFRR